MTSTKTEKPRAAIYTRISLDKSGERLGVQRQLDDCTALADRLGLTVVAHYDDNDISAFNGDPRPDFERLLDAMKRSEIDAVICWHQDRLYRSLTDLSRLLDVGSGMHVHTVTGGDLDLSTATGAMLATILGSVAINESAHKSERQRRAAVQKARRGLPKWRKAFGYKPYTGTKEDDTGVREVDPKVAKLVAKAYRDLLMGRSITSIAKEWNDGGYYGLTGKPWTPSTVSLFLRSPRNAGLRAHNGDLVRDEDGQPVRGTWPGLVDEELWQAAQSFLNGPGRRRPGPKSVAKHLLTGALVCGKCGETLGAQWVMQPTGGDPGRPKAGQVKKPSGQKNHTITYGCRNAKCRGVSMRAEHVVPLMYGIVGHRLAQADAVDLLRDNKHDVAEAQRVRQERAVLNQRLLEIADERADGLLTGQQAARATERIQDRLAALQLVDADHERLRVLDGLPLGTPEAADKLKELTPDRLRAVLGVVCTITVLPIGKGRRKDVEPRDRVAIDWKS